MSFVGVCRIPMGGIYTMVEMLKNVAAMYHLAADLAKVQQSLKTLERELNQIGRSLARLESDVENGRKLQDAEYQLHLMELRQCLQEFKYRLK